MSFEVTSYADLKKVGTGVDGWTLGADYIQTADIDASASATENPNGSGGYYGFVPIGTFAIPFEGSYDGQGHTISNLYINRQTDLIGLFSYIYNAEISNLGVISANITGNYGVGGFCGYSTGTITNCYSTGSISGTTDVGGFCGYNAGEISNCYSTGSVSGDTAVGGFCGYNYDTISNCYSTGSVSGDTAVGGFCGFNYDTISNCYSTGSVSGDTAVGGFCGYNYDTISNCYSTSSANGNYDIGGFCGYNYSTITSCYWDKQTSGLSTSSGGTGLTTIEMTYPYSENAYVGWNFVDIWGHDIKLINNGYPMLRVFLKSHVLILPASKISHETARLNGKVVII